MKKTRTSKKQIWDMADAAGYTASISAAGILITSKGEEKPVFEFETKSNREAYRWLQRKFYINYYGDEATAERYLI